MNKMREATRQLLIELGIRSCTEKHFQLVSEFIESGNTNCRILLDALGQWDKKDLVTAEKWYAELKKLEKEKIQRVEIKVEYKDKIYISDVFKLNESAVKQLKDSIWKNVSGDGGGINFIKDGNEIYIGKQILEQSIVTLVIY